MKYKKFLQYGIAGAALLISAVVYWNVHPENWLNTVGEPVSAAEVTADQRGDAIGHTAGDGLAPIQSIAEFGAVLPGKLGHVVVAPTEVISTGVYVKMPWWKPAFAAGTRNAYRNGNQPSVTQSTIFGGQYGYSEYQLVRLPDDSYIVALIDKKLAEAIRQGEQVTLPIGRKDGKLPEAERLLAPIMEQYGVTEKYVLYTMNDALYEKNDFIASMLRIGIAAGVFILLTIIAAVVFGKIFREE